MNPAHNIRNYTSIIINRFMIILLMNIPCIERTRNYSSDIINRLIIRINVH